LLAERNISVSYEGIRLWINKFGLELTKRLRRRHSGYGDTYYLDEVFVNIRGKQHYLWRAVDQDGMPSLDGASSMSIRKSEETPRLRNLSFNVFLKQAVYPEKSSPTNYGVMAWHAEH